MIGYWITIESINLYLIIRYAKEFLFVFNEICCRDIRVNILMFILKLMQKSKIINYQSKYHKYIYDTSEQNTILYMD